jgi:type II secretory pathway component PulC
MNHRLSERHIMVLNYFLITVLAYFAALAANDIMTGRSRTSEDFVARTVSRTADRTPNHSRTDYQAIVERDIFNLTPPPVVAPPPVIEDLHLSLIGISRMSKSKAFAIIQDQRGEQAVYRVGEMIPDSGKLIAVESDRAIVEHDGRKVTVALPADEISGPPGLRRLGMPEQVEDSDQGGENSDPQSVDSSTDPSADGDQ